MQGFGALDVVRPCTRMPLDAVRGTARGTGCTSLGSAESNMKERIFTIGWQGFGDIE